MTDPLMPFQREERYIVIKRKHLTDGHETDIRGYLAEIGVGTIECVVIESDWPEYETVWAMIEARVAGTSAAVAPKALAAECKHTSAKYPIDPDRPGHCNTCGAEVFPADQAAPLAAEGADPETEWARILYRADYDGQGKLTQPNWPNPDTWDLSGALGHQYRRQARAILAALSAITDPTLAREEGE